MGFTVVFGLIVLFHELGHFSAAKAFGIGVYEFGVGFGPPVFRRRWKETVYSVRILPLGGFVKLAGMDEAVAPGQAIDASDPRSFNNHPIWQKILAVVAGPFMNFVLAVLIFAVLFATVSVPPTIAGVLEGSPAAEAGLRAGDRVVSVNGVAVQKTGQISEAVRSSGGRPVTLVVERGGEELRFTVTPRLAAVPRGEQQWQIGVQLAQSERRPPGRAVLDSFTHTYTTTANILKAIWQMLTGEISASGLAGPIGIAGVIGETAEQGIANLAVLAAVLSINIGLVNLFPIPVLDGGWILFLLWEAVRGRAIEPEKRMIAQSIGVAFLLLLVLFATYHDIGRLIGG